MGVGLSTLWQRITLSRISMNRIFSSIGLSLESRVTFSKENYQKDLTQFKGRFVEIIQNLQKFIRDNPAKAAKMAGACAIAVVFFYIMKKSFEKLSQKEKYACNKIIKKEESPTSSSQVACKSFTSNTIVSHKTELKGQNHPLQIETQEIELKPYSHSQGHDLASKSESQGESNQVENVEKLIDQLKIAKDVSNESEISKATDPLKIAKVKTNESSGLKLKINSSAIPTLVSLPKNLKKLTLSIRKNAEMKLFKSLILPSKLQFFSLKFASSEPTYIQILPLKFYQNLPSLKSLNFSRVCLKNFNSTKLSESLESLSFDDCVIFTGNFHQMQNLKKLTIAIADLSSQVITLPTHLETLDLEEVNIKEILNASEIKELKSLSLKSSFNGKCPLTEDTIHSLLRPSLENLLLEELHELTSLDLTNHSNLKTLTLITCYNLINLELPENLLELIIQIPSGIHIDDFFKKLPMKNLKILRIFDEKDLDYCKKTLLTNYPELSVKSFDEDED